MQLPSLNNMTKTGATMLGLCCLAVAALAAEGYLIYQEVEKGRATYAELLSVETQKQNAVTMRETADAVAAPSSTIERYFVTPDTVSRVIEDLERLAEVAQVGFAMTGAEVVTEGGPRLELSFAASGSFVALHRFMLLAGHMPYAVQFTSAQLERGGAPAGEWQGQFAASIISFVVDQQ